MKFPIKKTDDMKPSTNPSKRVEPEEREERPKRPSPKLNKRIKEFAQNYGNIFGAQDTLNAGQIHQNNLLFAIWVELRRIRKELK